MWFYRIACMLLVGGFIWLIQHIAVSNGEWGYGFAVGMTAGMIIGAWAGAIERREKSKTALIQRPRD